MRSHPGQSLFQYHRRRSTEHHKWHEREAARIREEEGRQKWRVENPLEYSLTAVKNFFGINGEGTTKLDPTVIKEVSTPQIRLGSSPFPGSNRNTPAPKTPAVSASKTSKMSEPEQLPTPPSSIWDQQGPYSQVRQCLEGLENVSILDSLDNSLFTPAYTPEEVKGEDTNAAAAASYEDWNPYNFKDSCGTGLLEELDWEAVDENTIREGREWGGGNGFVMFTQD